MNWSINGKTIKSLMKDGKEIVKVERVEDGKILYEKENNNNYVVATVTGNSIKIQFYASDNWSPSVGDVVIDWGDGIQSTVNNPTTELSHTYTDGEQSHDITFIGVVTSLGTLCFYNCTGLTSVSIPNSVTSLGNRCFYGTGLTSVSIPNSVTSLGEYCFSRCTGLTSVSIPNSVTSLGGYCFSRCTGLTSVSIPNSVTSLGEYCFSRCNALIDYQLYWTGNNIITYDSNKMLNNSNTIFTIPVGETANYIAKGYPSNKLSERYDDVLIVENTSESITLGKNTGSTSNWLSTIGEVIVDWGDNTTTLINNPKGELEHTYTDDSSSHRIVFVGDVTSLNYYSFFQCAGLTSIIIPNSITNIGNYCFYGCTGLTNIVIPDSVTNIGTQCFYECTGLTSVTLPNSITELKTSCFSGCTGLTSINIPNTVTSIKEWCFNSCRSLTSVSIPDSVTNLGNGCFNLCFGLTDCQLYWTGNDIITYNSSKMPNNTNTVFTIPYGETANYVSKGYPSDKLVERST